MEYRKPEEDEHNLLREEERGSYHCYVLEYIHKETYQYSRSIYWIDKESFVPIFIEYYDRKGQIAKTLTRNIMEYIGQNYKI